MCDGQDPEAFDDPLRLKSINDGGGDQEWPGPLTLAPFGDRSPALDAADESAAVYITHGI